MTETMDRHLALPRQRPTERSVHVPFRTPRRHSVVFSGGIGGVCRVTAALSGSGCRICDFATEMHEGVGITGVTYTVAATPGEADSLAERLRLLPEVVAVEPY